MTRVYIRRFSRQLYFHFSSKIPLVSPLSLSVFSTYRFLIFAPRGEYYSCRATARYALSLVQSGASFFAF